MPAGSAIQLVLQDAELLLELSSKFAKILTCSSIGELARQPAASGELFSKHLYFAIPVHLHETTEQQKRSNCVKRKTAPVAAPSGAANLGGFYFRARQGTGTGS